MAKNNISQHNDIIFYSSPDGNVKVEVIYNDETFWLSQKAMAELFGVKVPAISKHLSNIFETNELDEKSVISKMEITANDGKNYKVTYYSLDAIIAVGYRVNSHQATQFRIWATKTLREFIIKGFVLDDERLKQGKRFGKDYFDELLERIREIRASERQIPMKMADWVTRLDAFLQFNEYNILKDAGKVSHDVAMKLAETEYQKFRVMQDKHFVSDFEKETKKIADRS